MAGTSRAVDKRITMPAPASAPDAYLDALERIIESEDVACVVPVSEETMHVAALHQRFAGRDRAPSVFCAPPARTLALHSKHDFIDLAREAGLDAPETERSGTAAAAALATRADVIIKPEFSCSGRGQRRVTKGTALPHVPAGHVIQAIVRGDEVSGFAIARAGRMLAACAYRPLIRHGSVAVAFERIDAPEVTAWMARFVEATGHTGFIAFDFIVGDDGAPQAIECNPRATSGLHFLRTGDIAPLVTGQADAAALRDEVLLQEFWSNWTHWFSAIGRGDERRRTGRALRRARDVTWQRNDPWVFLLATWSTWPIIGQALRRGETFAEVLALDIEYRPRDETSSK